MVLWRLARVKGRPATSGLPAVLPQHGTACRLPPHRGGKSLAAPDHRERWSSFNAIVPQTPPTESFLSGNHSLHPYYSGILSYNIFPCHALSATISCGKRQVAGKTPRPPPHEPEEEKGRRFSVPPALRVGAPDTGRGRKILRPLFAASVDSPRIPVRHRPLFPHA